MKLSIKNSTDEERSFVVKVIVSGRARFTNAKSTDNAIIAILESVDKVFILTPFGEIEFKISAECRVQSAELW